VDRLSVYRNDKVSLTWISSDAANIRLLKNNVEYAEVPAVTKGFPLTTDTDGVLKIEAIPVRDDGKEGEPSWVFITVTEPPPTPDPVIKSCYIQGTSTIKLGSPFILHYTIKNADKAYIGETMEPIDINVNERDLTGPSQTGKYSYTLIAQNGNKVTTRKFSITVIDPSTASIGSFAADPSVLTAAGPVTLRWHVSGATSLYLSGDDFPEQSLDINQTEIQVNIAKDSKFVLRAVDDKGRATTMSAKVQIQPIDLTPPPPSSAPDAQPTPPPTTPSLGNP
jgi:hypothetical protein